jgi:hypothetical protein
MVIHLLLAHDIETNPGPQPMTQPQPMHKSTVTVVSLNCRGLGNMDKARLLLNKIYSLSKTNL